MLPNTLKTEPVKLDGGQEAQQTMRHVNGLYTQRYNRRHGKVGHLFQGRIKGILIQEDRYLAEVCRYVDLNRVRAGMVPHPADWPWSSYNAVVG